MNDRTTIPKLSRSVTLLMVVAALSAWMGTMSSVLLVQQTRKVGELQAENRALQVSARTLKALESETMKFFDPKGFDIPAPRTEWSKITAEGRMIWDDSRWVKEAEYDKKQGKIHETVNALKAMGATKITFLPADKIHPLSSRVRAQWRANLTNEYIKGPAGWMPVHLEFAEKGRPLFPKVKTK